MQEYLIEYLECPSCHGSLNWKIIERTNKRIEEAEIKCNSCSANYHVHKSIGVFLAGEIERNDLWKKADSGLVKYLRSNPDVKQELMNTPLKDLSPADQFFRAMVLEEQGLYIEAKEIEKIANSGLYSRQYQFCWQKQIDYVLVRLADNISPVLDIASGRGYLLEKMVNELNCPIIGSDFSLTVLERNLHYLKAIGLYEKVSLLAFDARVTPFKDGTFANITTNLGLPNIEQPGSLLKELHRILSGNLFAITHFFQEVDELNGKIIHEAGLDQFLYQQPALEQFSDAGWIVEIRNTCEGVAKPTPEGEVLKGAKIDGLPVTETILKWCVLEGR